VTDPLVTARLKVKGIRPASRTLAELKEIRGANWDLEIGALTEVSASLADSKVQTFSLDQGISADEHYHATRL